MKQGPFDVVFNGEKFPCYYATDPVIIREILETHLLLKYKDELCAIDIETQALVGYRHIEKAALSPHLSKPRLIQIYGAGQVSVLDYNYFDDSCDGNLRIFLERGRFIAHNATFELMFFKKLGIHRINIGCTMLLAKLIQHAKFPEDTAASSVSLANLVHQVFKVDLKKQMQVSDWSVPDLTLEQLEYSALDAITTLKLAEKLAPSLSKYGLERIYQLTKAAQHPIAEMQLNGLGMDVEHHKSLIPVWREEVFKAKQEVLEITGLDDTTPAKLGDWLEKELPAELLRTWPRTATGKLSTDAKTLADYDDLEILEPYSKFQKQSKLATVFGHPLLKIINPATGRVHCSYNLCGARTGRLSSSSPNLQQLPRDESIRKSFAAAEGNTLVCADFNQIELRVAAEISRDERMLESYRNGIDLHALTASIIGRKDLSEVTKADRQKAKAFNFGLLFGLGAAKFSKYARQSYGVNVTQEEAENAINDWRNLYAGYRSWQISTAAQAKSSMRTTTPCGKRRKLNEANYYGGCLNTPVQGGAAEVMLASLISLQRTLQGSSASGRLLSSVHDEIIVECLEVEAPAVASMVETSMIQGFLEIFPTGITRGLVEAHYGRTWADAKP